MFNCQCPCLDYNNKMTKETKIAKENVENYNNYKDGKVEKDVLKNILIEHKQTCQRWLEFLESYVKNLKREDTFVEIQFPYYFIEEIDEQIEDLKQAIKTYEDAGI